MSGKSSPQLILRVSLVPKPLHYINLRNAVGGHQWKKKLRPTLLDAQKELVCCICKAKTETPSDLKAHEKWSYDTSSTPAFARLEAITLICESCHRCDHFMNTVIQVEDGRYPPDAVDETVRHFCRVNKASNGVFERHLKEAIAENKRLSKLKWRISFGAYSHMVDDAGLKRLEARIPDTEIVVRSRPHGRT